jgi:uncharacterized protein (TIGR02246 family)
MKTRLEIPLAFHLALALWIAPHLCAEEPSPEIAGLQKAASDFVTSYNNKDAAAVAALFTENGETINLAGEVTTSGRAEIKTRYETILSDPECPEIAVEVNSVRLITPSLAIEDGVYYLAPADGEGTVQSITYTAVLLKNDKGAWEIASSRSLNDVTDAAGQLADLATDLKGEWSSQIEDVRTDFVFGWDDTGNFLTGEAITTAAGAEPQTTTIRYGWDGASKSIIWWTFDSKGGFSKGSWTPVEDGWTVRTQGTTSDGETSSATGHLTVEGKDSIIWKATDRLINGEELPDNEIRLVRRPPEPAPEAASEAPADPTPASE